MKTNIINTAIESHLVFNNIFLLDILEGSKRTTVRSGIRATLQSNIDFIFRDEQFNNNFTIHNVLITNIEYKKLCELDDTDALRDGFNNARELIEFLKSIYTRMIEDDYVTIFTFQIPSTK